MKRSSSMIALAVCLALALPVPAQVPPPAPAPAPAPAAAPAAAAKTFSQEELDQLLAPIALYPDALLAQVLMASTYPLEIVAAERWVKANPGLKDKALEDALQQQTWDPSVKSLAVFPQVLTMMSEKLDWTQKLGDAFLAQQKDVMATAQALRAKALGAGLAQGLQGAEGRHRAATSNTTVIKIEPTNPEVVYVPTYNPTVVYGAWPYPAYPPYYYYPPGYVAGGALLGFTAGVIVGGALWGNCNWGGGDVNVNVNRYNNFNRTNISNGNWNHNAEHRGAVPYRDKGVAQAVRARPGERRRVARRVSRARRRGSRADPARRGVGARRSGARRGRRAHVRRDARHADRPGRPRHERRRDWRPRHRSGTRNASAFDTRGGAQTRDYSNRGASSMNSARIVGQHGRRQLQRRAVAAAAVRRRRRRRRARWRWRRTRRRRTALTMRAMRPDPRNAMEITMKLDRSTWLRASGWTWLLPVLLALALVRPRRAGRDARPRRRSRRRRTRSPRSCRRSRRTTARRSAPCSGTRPAPSRRATPSPTARSARASSPRTTRSTRSRATATRRSSTIGTDDFPFAFPLVKTGDTLALRHRGRQGRAARAPDRRERARRDQGACRRSSTRSASTHPPTATATACSPTRASSRARKGKRDGLYWPTKAGEPPSPLGELVVHAAGEGYKAKQGEPDALPRLLLPDARRARARMPRAARSTTSCAAARSAASPSSRIRRSTAVPAS